MRHFAIVAALLASPGCTGDGGGFPVTVTVHDEAGAVRPGLRIVFGAPDGSVTEAVSDAAGQAAATVEPGGSAWLVEQIFSDVHLTAFTGLADGDAPVFGRAEPVVVPATRARMTITGAPPPAFEAAGFTVGATCGGPDPALPHVLVVDDRCAATVDVLAVAYGAGLAGARGHVVAYALLPAQAITDGALVAVPDVAWRAPALVELRLTGAPAGVYADAATELTDDLGTYVLPTDGTTGTVRAFLPLVGDHVRVRTTFHRDQLQQQVVLELPAVATQSIDTTQLLAPWVAQVGRGPVRWSANDDSGALAVNAAVLTQVWPVTDTIGQPLTVTLRTIARDPPPTELLLPLLPDSLAGFRPPYITRSRLQLLRFGDLTPSDSDRFRDDIALGATLAPLLAPQLVPTAVSQTVGAGE